MPQTTPPQPRKERNTALFITLFSFLIFLRSTIGFHKHSGQDNHHGKVDAYGGDYEAQRHWMELTLHLPLSEWYTHDLSYWGLDYPPLTAYVSYIFGYLSHTFISPESMALYSSRYGYEEAVHKSFMRWSVLILDISVYMTVVYVISRRLVGGLRRNDKGDEGFERSVYWLTLICLVQPSILLIDHGHFQYNTVALGLALWSFYFMTLEFSGDARSKQGTSRSWLLGIDAIGPFYGCIVGSIFFCLSLNFKQMSLYYAPAVFSYLLGRCFSRKAKSSVEDSETIQLPLQQSLARFMALGLTVILTFAFLWIPFVLYRSEDQTALDAIFNIVNRLFPFQRGLFENKVSNIWFVLSLKPLSIRRRLSEEKQPLVALVWTLLLILPSCARLFRLGLGERSLTTTAKKQQEKLLICRHLKIFLWAATNSSLSFFLVSFQVHEKSILMSLSPLSLFYLEAPMVVWWFGVACTWTMWHLFIVDRLQLPYGCCLVIFGTMVGIHGKVFEDIDCGVGRENKWNLLAGLKYDIVRSMISLVVVMTSVVGMLGLHLFECLVEPPENMPDLFPVLWNICGCGMFVFTWVLSCWELYRL